MTSNPTAGLYDTPGNGRFFSPFLIQIEPIERLLLVSFERDPDDIYQSLEVQAFNDPQHGQGFAILAYRRDRKIDIYHQPGIRLKTSQYATVGKGVQNMIVRPLEGARFEITARGLETIFAFEDLLGRPVKLEIRENRSRPPGSFNLLAPLGDSAEDPPFLPLYWMYRLSMVRRGGTEITIEIGGQRHRPDRLPLPVIRELVYLVRYSLGPQVLNWNPWYDGLLESIPAQGGEAQFEHNTYTLIDQNGHLEITTLRAAYAGLETVVQFNPPFPDLAALKDGASMEGTFTVQGDPTVGKVTGRYSVQQQGSETRLRMHPSGGWQPNEPKWSMRLTYLLVPSFCNWPKTYEWNAVITRQPDGLWQKSGWRRIED